MARADRDDNFREIRQAALEQGWVVSETGKQRWRFLPPNKEASPVVFSGASSDWRAIRNFVSCLRQRGLKVPARFGGK